MRAMRPRMGAARALARAPRLPIVQITVLGSTASQARKKITNGGVKQDGHRRHKARESRN